MSASIRQAVSLVLLVTVGMIAVPAAAFARWATTPRTFLGSDARSRAAVQHLVNGLSDE